MANLRRWLPKLRSDSLEQTPRAQRVRTRAARNAAAEEMTHPWTELVLRKNKIVQSNPRTREAEYLATPEVKIVGKKEAIANADGPRASYAFKLNTAPDEFWRDRFAKNLERLPEGINRTDLRVEITDDTLLLLCLPTRLDAKYACVKENVARTNADYQAERRAVIERLSRDRGQKSAARKKIDLVRQKFDRLEI